MCGIVYVRRKDGKPANRSIRKRYFKQKYRGTEGFGYVAVRDNKVVAYERAPSEHEIMEKLKKETAPEILFHHRYPTSTPNLDEQAHPLFIGGTPLKYQYFIAHNGVIRNADARKEVHRVLGIPYRTQLTSLVQTSNKKTYHFGTDRFNDSEALAVDTALAIENIIKIIPSEGAAAVVGLILDGEKVIDRIFYRNKSNPLKYQNDQVMTTLTSLGSGSDVDFVHIMRLNDDGTFEKHPSNVWTPFTYVLPYYSGRDSGSTTALPPRQPVIDGLPATIRLDELPAFKGHDLAHGKADFLTNMSDINLWDEAERVSKARKEIVASMAELDDRVDAEDFLSSGIMAERSKLQARFERIKGYEAKLLEELEQREKNAVHIVTGSEEDLMRALDEMEF